MGIRLFFLIKEDASFILFLFYRDQIFLQYHQSFLTVLVVQNVILFFLVNIKNSLYYVLACVLS